MRKLKLIIVLGCLLSTSIVFAQDSALQNLIHGKKFFWEAKFDQALASLKKVTAIETARSDYLFEAYLYIGFVLVRQNAPSTEIQNAFKRAISIDPDRDLDESIIPPDLAAPFKEAKGGIAGCLYVQSIPELVTVTGVEGDSVLFVKKTPFSICDLVTRDYELLFTEEGYEQRLVPLNLVPGKKDTVMVQLTSLHAKRQKRRGLKWAIGGGVLATAGAILYKTVLSEGDNSEAALPAPPARADIGN